MKKHNISYEVQSQLPDGNWATATPEPFWTTKGVRFWKRWDEKNWLPQCDCGEIFKTRAEYDRHYALAIRHDKVNDLELKDD